MYIPRYPFPRTADSKQHTYIYNASECATADAAAAVMVRDRCRRCPVDKRIFLYVYSKRAGAAKWSCADHGNRFRLWFRFFVPRPASLRLQPSAV